MPGLGGVGAEVFMPRAKCGSLEMPLSGRFGEIQLQLVA